MLNSVDPLALALLKNGGAGGMAAGPVLIQQPEQRMRNMLAQQLLGADPASARTKGEGMARLGQQLLGAYLAKQGMDEAKAQRESDSGLMAAALRSQDKTPTTYTDDAGKQQTITWNKPDPSTMTTIMAQGSPQLQQQALAMALSDRQRQADIAAKTVTMLTPEQVRAAGLPPGAYQRDAFGKVDQIAKAPLFGMPGPVGGDASGGAPAATPAAPAAGGTQTVPKAGGGMTAAPLRPAIARAALENNIDPVLALTAAHIESGMGTAPDRKGSQYQGVFQMGDDRWKEAGGTPEARGDQGAQVSVGVKSLGMTRDQLAQKIGRQPEPWEVYLAHQQGVTGAAALLGANPDASAVQALAPFYKDGKNLQAIVGNMPGEPDANITAGGFTGLWRDRFNNIAKNYGNPAVPQVAQGGPAPSGPAAQDMAAGLADPARSMPPGSTVVQDAPAAGQPQQVAAPAAPAQQPVQVAQANTGTMTDAAPAAAPAAVQPPAQQFRRPIDPESGKMLDFELPVGPNGEWPRLPDGRIDISKARTYQKPPEPTDLTKLRTERDALPPGSPDRAIYDAEINKKTSGAKPQGFEVESDLRDKFNALQPVKNFREVVPIYQSMKDAATRDNPAADLNIVYGVAKIMDPASVVREGETQMAVATGSPAERLLGTFNYVAGGGRLTPEVREALLKEAESRFQGHQNAYIQTRDQYQDLAKSYGVDPKRSIIDIRLPEQPDAGQQGGGKPAPGQGGAPAAAPATKITNDDAGRAAYEALPSGTVFTAPDGTTRRKP